MANIQVTDLGTPGLHPIKAMYVGGILKERIIDYIIQFKLREPHNLTNESRRKWVALYSHISESVSTLTGNPFAFCDEYQLHARIID